MVFSTYYYIPLHNTITWHNEGQFRVHRYYMETSFVGAISMRRSIYLHICMCRNNSPSGVYTNRPALTRVCKIQTIIMHGGDEVNNKPQQ